MAAPAFLIPNQQSTRLADPSLREALLKFARRRLPPGEVDDLVQNTLTDALASNSAPAADAEFRRWVQGIARNKVADLYRRRGRLPPLSADTDLAVADPGPATGELKQWIEQELPKTEGAQATLHWLLRESEGESLDEIARDAALPAPRVRQRVSRLRRHFQTRWLALGAAGLALLVGAGMLFHVCHGTPAAEPVIAREAAQPSVSPSGALLLPVPALSVPGASSSAPAAKPTPLHKLRVKTRAPSKKLEAPSKPRQLRKQDAAPNQKAMPAFEELQSKSNFDGKPLAPTKN